MTLTDSEIEALAENFEVLEALADQHDSWAAMAEATGFGNPEYHDIRRAELLEEASRLRAVRDRELS